jgi:acyl-CoA thioester hydrolase
MKAIVSASARFQPQFYDIDPMQIVWHGNYARFFELGRCAVMDKIGYSYDQMRDSGFAWPIIDMHLRYYRPLRLGQQAEVTAGIVEWENRLGVRYLIQDVATGQKLTRGTTMQVALDIETQEMLWETPAILREKLSPYLP